MKQQRPLEQKPAEPAGPPPEKKQRTESYKWEDKERFKDDRKWWEEQGKYDRRCVHCLGYGHAAAGCPVVFRAALQEAGKDGAPSEKDRKRYNIPIYSKYCFKRRKKSEKTPLSGVGNSHVPRVLFCRGGQKLRREEASKQEAKVCDGEHS